MAATLVYLEDHERARSLNPAENLFHYCVVRRDLPPGHQAAQLIHAAGESSPGNLPHTTSAVALTCPDEAALRAIAEKLKAAGVRHCAIIESDGVYAGQLMAIGLEPCPKEVPRKLLSSLPLLR